MMEKTNRLHRGIALLLCVLMVAALIPAPEARAYDCSAPVISASISGNGILISWLPVGGGSDGDNAYLVYRSSDGGTTWEWVNLTKGTSFKDTKVTNGTQYKYFVEVVANASKYPMLTPNSDQSNWVTITYYVSNAITGNTVASAAEGIYVKWDNAGAACYSVAVAKDVGGTPGSFSYFFTTNTTYLIQASTLIPNQKYWIFVQGVNADRTVHTTTQSTWMTCVYAQPFIITGLNVTAALTPPYAGHIEIDWSSGPTSATYHVKRSDDKNTWFEIGTTTSLSYTDIGVSPTNLLNNTTYYYKVTYVDGAGNEVETPVASTKFYTTPELLDLVEGEGQFTIKWTPVAGAPKYQILRRNNLSDPWQWLANVDSSKSSYTDTTIAAGWDYYYTVRVVSADGSQALSGYNDDGLKDTFIGMPTLVSTHVDMKGNIIFTWNKVGSISFYNVYRKRANSSVWELINPEGSITYDSASDTWKFTHDTMHITSGETYTYTVACANSSGNDISKYDLNGLKCTKYDAPIITNMTVANGGIEVKFNPITKVTRYQVFRSEDGGTTWKPLGFVSDPGNGSSTLVYLDKTAQNLGVYSYAVRCVSADGKQYLSGYTSSGTILFYATPVMVSATTADNVASGCGAIVVNWQAVPGATEYTVFRRTIHPNGYVSDWYVLKNGVTGTTYVDQDVSGSLVSNCGFNYTVRVSSGTTMLSWYQEAGVTDAKFVGAPRYIHCASKEGQIWLRWEAVEGATGYRVYRKVGSGTWSEVYDLYGIGSLIFHDTNQIMIGETYSYVVRARIGNYWSGYLNTITPNVNQVVAVA